MCLCRWGEQYESALQPQNKPAEGTQRHGSAASPLRQLSPAEIFVQPPVAEPAPRWLATNANEEQFAPQGSTPKKGTFGCQVILSARSTRAQAARPTGRSAASGSAGRKFS